MSRKKLKDIKTKFDAEEMIEYHINQGGPYSHNLIGVVLREADKQLGRAVANDLIDDYSLDSRYGMNKEEVDD